MERPASVEAYLASLTPEQRAALDALRGAIRAAAPDATEGISYSMAAFKYDGKGLVCYAAFKDHYSLFPMSKQVIADNLEALGAARDGQGHDPLRLRRASCPSRLVKRIVKARLAEVEARSTPLSQLVAASASWPHAASIERPRVSRTVTFAPSFSSVCTKRRMRAGGEPSTG